MLSGGRSLTGRTLCFQAGVSQSLNLRSRRPAEAIQLLRELTALRGHEFWVDDIALAESEFIDTDRIIGHRQITDAHLVALSLRHRGKLATFDAGIAEVVPAGIDREAPLVILRG